MPDVRDDDGPDFVAREQMPAAEPAERDGEISARRAVDGAAQQVYARRPVHRDDRQLQVEQPLEQRGDRRPRHPARPGAEQRVHHDADSRPGPVGRHFAHALRAGERGHALAQRRGIAGRRGDPDGHVEPMERTGNDPAVAAVVTGTGGDEHAFSERDGETCGE